MADWSRSRQHIALALFASAAWLWPFAPPVAAQEVVQPLPDPAAGVLNAALQRLARDPQSVAALVEAGQASLALNDVDAAMGFFNRAAAVAPGDGSVLAGLGQVAVRRGEAASAVQLFDNAEAAGFAMAPLAAERGLAHDLAGDNARAQQFYRQALAREADPEVTRRLALSYAIGGNAAASEAELLPLLQQQDRAAYRARAFSMAILGRQEEAVTIAETMLPAQLADRLEPYLRYMPRLTRAQQAAAVNLGRFPAASQIGRDEEPQLAVQAAQPPVAVRSSGPDQRLIPGGAPLGQAAAPVVQPPAPPPVVPPPPPPVVIVARLDPPPPPLEPPSREPPPQAELPPLAAVASVELAAAPPPVPLPEPAMQSEVPPLAAAESALAAPPAEAAPAEVAVVAEPIPATEQPSEAPLTVIALEQPAPPPTSLPEPVPDLAEAFAEFAADDAPLPLAATAGAVDITRITIARERPPPPPPAPPPPPPAPPAHPSRHWVQVATGQDTGAFRFDWRRIRREAGGLLDNREPFQARWGQSNRLVTGPFPSASAANALVSQLSAKGVESFRFTSAMGEEVRPLQ